MTSAPAARTDADRRHDRLDRVRSTIELVGAVAVTATNVLAVVGAVTSIVRRGAGCR